MRDDGPTVREITTAVYVIPTDAPEADGTLAWDATTMVLARVEAGAEQGIGWTYAAAAAQSVITDTLAGVVAGRSALDVPGHHRGDDPGGAQHRPAGDRGHGDLRGRHRAVGSQVPAARLPADRAARPGARQRSGLRERRFHQL